MAHAPYIIDLEKYTAGEIKSFHNRSWGIKVRNASNIDKIEPGQEKIIIRIPQNAENITTPFFEEFLENVVFRLGEAGFNEKFHIENKSAYSVTPYVSEAIRNILKKEIVY